MQAQLSGLIVQNEALDSLFDVTQSAISGSYVLYPDTLVQSETDKVMTGAVMDTAMIATRENAVTDTLSDRRSSAWANAQTVSLADSSVTQSDTAKVSGKILVVTNEEQNAQLQPDDSLVNKEEQDTGKASNRLLTTSGSKDVSQPQREDSLGNKINGNQSSGFLTGNTIVIPIVNDTEKDTVNIRKDTAAMQRQIRALEDSLVNKTAVNKSSDSLLSGSSTIYVPGSQQKDSLHNKTNISQGPKGFLTGNAVIVPVGNKTREDSIPDISGNNSSEEVAMLQARIKALEDSLNNKNNLNKGTKEILKGNTAVLPVVNKNVTDTVSVDKTAAKDNVAALQDRINKLEDSLRNNTVAGKGGLLTAPNSNGVSQQHTADTTNSKPDARNVSSDISTKSDNEEVSRLRAELADLQKEKESLMQQLDKTAAPVSPPEKINQVSRNENVATQEDVNALKSEIQSLKEVINTSNNKGVGQQRSLLPPMFLQLASA